MARIKTPCAAWRNTRVIGGTSCEKWAKSSKEGAGEKRRLVNKMGGVFGAKRGGGGGQGRGAEKAVIQKPW